MSTAPKVYQVLIVDDHPLFRDGLATYLERSNEFHVCGHAEDSRNGFSLVLSLKPDLVIVDLNLREGSGLELLKSIKAQELDVKMLVISGLDEQLYARRCLRAGASGFVTKIESLETIETAIRKVLSGHVYLNPALSAQLLSQALHGKSVDDRHDLLSDREFQVLVLCGQGLGTVEIGHRLNLSEKTVASHRITLMKKLGFSEKADLIQYALRFSQDGY